MSIFAFYKINKSYLNRLGYYANLPKNIVPKVFLTQRTLSHKVKLHCRSVHDSILLQMKFLFRQFSNFCQLTKQRENP